MADVKIYSAEVCPYAERSRLVLHEKNVELELIEIDLANKPDWFNDVSPYGKVPALDHGGKRVYESAIINEYLDEVFADPPLLPADPERRAIARIWIDYCNTRLGTPAYKLIREDDPKVQKDLKDELITVLRFMEKEGLRKISDGPYWMGTEPTLVDFAFYPHFERYCVIEHYRGFKIPEGCTRILSWLDAMRGRASVKAIENPPQFYIDRYAKQQQTKNAA
jgi:glutathione S-transferase